MRCSSSAPLRRPQIRRNGFECSECSNKFTTAIRLGNFVDDVGGKFTDPKCGASFDVISAQKTRITVEVLAKGETRTYGKTYDVATKDYARPL